MTCYDVHIPADKVELGLKEVFAWLEQQGWKHLSDWRWYHPFKEEGIHYYTFQFDQEKHANWFALRWS